MLNIKHITFWQNSMRNEWKKYEFKEKMIDVTFPVVKKEFAYVYTSNIIVVISNYYYLDSVEYMHKTDINVFK